MSKMSFLAGIGVGYVLGARAGRQRYEQIKSGAQGVWNSPKVQETVSHAQEVAAQKAPVVQHKLAETASSAVHKVSDKVSDKVGHGGSANGAGAAGGEGDAATPAGFVENPAQDHRAD